MIEKPGSAFREISSRESLRKAWKEISKRNMRSRGLDNVTIRAFKNRLEENLAEISQQLRLGTYTFTKLRAHAVDKPGTQKKRPLQIASVRDRVVMKALSIFIEPAFSKFNSHCSYAFIKGRGVNKAIERIHQLVAEGNKYYFEADIINFFGSVDRSALWSMFSGQVKHRSLHPILKQCFNLELEDLKSYDTAFQELFLGSDSGVPQGGVLSPMLANFYLYHFDRKMLENHFNLVRYADDFVVMCKTEEEAQRAHDFSKNILRSLNLQIHELEAPNSKTRIGNFSKDGLSFLGVRFEGPHTFPTKKSITRFEKKVEEVLKPETGESLFKTLQKLANLINGWGKCYRSMRVLEIYLRLDDFIKRRVEDYLDREGVRLLGKKRGRQMKFLGVPSLTAMIQHSPRAKATSAGE